MAKERVIFNELQLRKVVKDSARAELDKQLKKLNFEVRGLWTFLNKMREDVNVLMRDMEMRKRN